MGVIIIALSKNMYIFFSFFVIIFSSAKPYMAGVIIIAQPRALSARAGGGRSVDSGFARGFVHGPF